MLNLSEILAISTARHSHLCPRQVLGARAALDAAAWLDLDLPRRDKRLLVIAETDGCFVDGVMAASGVSVGHRTLRIEDYGKIAATFIDTHTGRALRLVPAPTARDQVWNYVVDEPRPYFVQLLGYQRLPADLLWQRQEVELTPALADVLSMPGRKVICARCGEEIINDRQLTAPDGAPICRACAGDSYYCRPETA
jgi:formylmethanofuran dehydrogenase subunit E